MVLQYLNSDISLWSDIPMDFERRTAQLLHEDHRETYRIDRAITIVVVGVNMHVKIGRLHETQMGLVCGRECGKRMEGGKQTGCAGTGEQFAAGKPRIELRTHR